MWNATKWIKLSKIKKKMFVIKSIRIIKTNYEKENLNIPWMKEKKNKSKNRLQIQKSLTKNSASI